MCVLVFFGFNYRLTNKNYKKNEMKLNLSNYAISLKHFNTVI